MRMKCGGNAVVLHISLVSTPAQSRTSYYKKWSFSIVSLRYEFDVLKCLQNAWKSFDIFGSAKNALKTRTSMKFAGFFGGE